MIGFGELRRLSTQWHTDLANVERAYAITCLLRAIFAHEILARDLVLRASAALRYAYCADYPSIVEPEFLMLELRDVSSELDEALRVSSGASFKLATFERGAARIEFVGPLGRRSAAQPRITLTLLAGQTRLPPTRATLLSPFSDNTNTTVVAMALEELIAERVALFATSPRARDVFDVWFVLRHTNSDRAPIILLAQQIATEKQIAVPTRNSFKRELLARVWDQALREIPARPAFEQVIQDFERELDW